MDSNVIVFFGLGVLALLCLISKPTKGKKEEKIVYERYAQYYEVV